MQTTIDKIRTKAGEFYSQYGYFLPRRKVIAATVGATLAGLASKYLGLDLPGGVAETIGAAIFGYFVPEKPDVSLTVEVTPDTVDPVPGQPAGFRSEPLDFVPDEGAGEEADKPFDV